jgi:alkylation response protein AidB-like acyl-CoA dehydrogenase
MTAAMKDLLADLSDLAARHKDEGDTLRRLPPVMTKAFLQHDVYRLILPRDLGGANVEPLEYLQLVEKIASVDGSIAWNLTIGIGSVLYGGYLPIERSQTLFANAHCGIAGAYAPFGRAEVVDGGYRVSGRWGWASGIHQARWIVFGFTVQSSNGPPEIRQALAPRDAFRILDTWHVSGMRGTGSTDYEVDGLFVPADMTFKVFKSEPCHPAPVFRMPAAFFAAAIAVVTLGIARGAIEGLKHLAGEKRSLPGRTSLRDQPSAHYAVAKAEALTESGSLYLRDAVAAMWRNALAGDEIKLAQRAHVRRACVHAAEASADGVDICCRAAGGHALLQSQPFERALRDIRAALGHIVLQRSALEDVGRTSFGLDPLFPTF